MPLSKKLCKIDTLLLHTTNKKDHMAYWFVPFPMTFNNVKDHVPVTWVIKCNSQNIYVTFHVVSTDVAYRMVPRQQLSFLFKILQKTAISNYALHVAICIKLTELVTYLSQEKNFL